jgi:predicted nuclease of restriction endonuclease-like (RecB) superfamily
MDNGDIAKLEYKKWLTELKQRVRQTQVKAAVQVNTALLTFYWDLGADIVERQKTAQWGSGFLKQLSVDLMAEFPDVKGFSEANIRFVRRWYLFYSEAFSNSVTSCDRIGQQSVAQLVQIPWGHNRVIISKCKDVAEALYYVQQTMEQSWSRSVLTHQIEGGR